MRRWIPAAAVAALCGCSAMSLDYLKDGSQVSVSDAGADATSDAGADAGTALDADAAPGSDALAESSATIDAAPDGPTLPQTITISDGVAVGIIDWPSVVAGGTANGGNQGDPLTNFTQPTCPTSSGQPIIGNGFVCGSPLSWPTANALCATGTIPALSCTDAGTCNYGDDWGALVGLNAPAGASLRMSLDSIAVTFSGAPDGVVMRMQIVVAGTTYCSTAPGGSYASGTPATLSSFNATCWAPTPAGALQSFEGLTQISLMIVSGSVDVSFDNFCITGITLD